MIYGYVRTERYNTPYRQISFIKEKYPDAEIAIDTRKSKGYHYLQLLKLLKPEDTVVIFSVIIFSENDPEAAYSRYISLVNTGARIISLKESYFCSDVMAGTLKETIYNQLKSEFIQRSDFYSNIDYHVEKRDYLKPKKPYRQSEQKIQIKKIIVEKSKDFNGTMKAGELLEYLEQQGYPLKRRTFFSFRTELLKEKEQSEPTV